MSVTTNYIVASEGQLNAALAAIDVGGSQSAINTAYTITLSTTIALTSGPLDAINLASGDKLTIAGANHVIDGSVNGVPTQRGLFVYSGAVTIENLTIENCVAKGGVGGAGGGGGGGGGWARRRPVRGEQFGCGAAPADVTLDDVVFQDDSAVGGAGGARSYGVGGGGGLGGAGGAAARRSIRRRRRRIGSTATAAPAARAAAPV